MPVSRPRALVSSIAALLLAPSFAGCGASGPAEPAPQTASVDPRVASCQRGDSKTCNALGDEQWGKESWGSARQFFEVSCNRIRPSLEANARRLVELDLEAKAAWQVINAGASGAAIPPEQAHAALDTTKRLQPEADEIKERIEGCTRAGDTWDIDGDHKKALPYYDAMCRLMAIRDRASSIIAGFEYVVGSACDAGHFSREQMASDAQFRARLGGILAQGAQNIAGNVATGMAKVEAAKRGEIVVDNPPQGGPTALAANAGPAAGGGCPDFGKSCESDPTLLSWKQRCQGNTPVQAACYCATAAAYKCFIAHGCYAEAGAKRPDGQPSDTRLASLQQGASDSSQKASQLGTSCGL